jgi:hypothetical protein
MNTIQSFLIIAGSAFIIAGCQDLNNESSVATTEQSTIDTVPKGRTDSMMNKPDTMISSMGAPRYIDLSTGQVVDLYYDAKKNRVYSTVTNEPVDFYVDMSTGDTIYGTGRYVVNNYIVKSPEGHYKLDMKKVKMEKNELKMKEGNKKFKMDKSDMQMKGSDMKMKGDTTSGKRKTGDMKMKMDDKEEKTKS